MELEAVEKFSVALLLLFAKSADHFAEKLEEVFEPQGQAAGGQVDEAEPAKIGKRQREVGDEVDQDVEGDCNGHMVAGLDGHVERQNGGENGRKLQHP